MLAAGTLMAFYLCLTLVMNGKIYYRGNCILLSWKQKKWPNIFTDRLDKFRKSCKPFQVNWGKIFVVERLSVLIFVRSVSTGILNSLLAL